MIVKIKNIWFESKLNIGAWYIVAKIYMYKIAWLCLLAEYNEQLLKRKIFKT